MKLSKNFFVSEFNCNDGTLVPHVYHVNRLFLCHQLEVIRLYSKGKIFINSAYRYPAYNEKIGGVPNSMHLFCKAADIRSDKLSPLELGSLIVDLIDKDLLCSGAVIIYKTFVHYDVRGYKYVKCM